MPSKSASEYVTVQIRLSSAEHALLKSHGKPNITSWVRAKIRELPGGEKLDPLPAPSPPDEAPPWRPQPVVAKPGDIALQVTVFVAAISAVSLQTSTWKKWRPVQELYEGLRELLSKGHGLRSLWRDANQWKARGKRPHANQALFEALFKYKTLEEPARRWYDQHYQTSNAKRLRAKAANPEQFLAKQRDYMRDYRARQRASAAAIEKADRAQASFDEFMRDHVTQHGAEPPLPSA